MSPIDLKTKIQALEAEWIDLTDQSDHLEMLHKKYCQAPACPLPQKIKPMNIGPPARRPQGELSWGQNPFRKILRVIWPVSFAYYFQRFLELFRWPF